MSNLVDLVETHKNKAQFHSDMAKRATEQLEKIIPEDAAGLLGQFCAMAPGIPWSNEVLDAMLADLRNGDLNIKFALPPRIGCDRAHVTISPIF